MHSTVVLSLLISTGIFKQSMRAGNRVGIELSYRPAKLNRLAELIPWNQFLGSLNVKNFGLRSSDSMAKLAAAIPRIISTGSGLQTRM